MAVKIYTNEFNNIVRLWVKNDNNFTPDEQKFMKDAGMRASKNPKSWFCKHDAETEAVVRNFFEGGAEESHYEPIEEESKMITCGQCGCEFDVPKNAKIYKCPQCGSTYTEGKTVHLSTGKKPAKYVPVDDYQIYEKACRLATDLCDGLHNLPDEDTVKKWIEFYYIQLTKHARGE